MNLWIDSETPPSGDYKWIKSPNGLVNQIAGLVVQEVSIGNKLGYLSTDDIIDIIAIHNNRVELITLHGEGDHHEIVKKIKTKLNAKVKTWAYGKLYDQENM